ncbi:hypothetical protein SD71_01800 [Cohnella kolymensis]|uniref:Uncharacterized protein n=1 Tax=Cohnella kolymensis TaxID=1590652 RepID=A0ABR5A932_9BACL|nr:hypothetical protein [Cohnella kolymensis]KIL37417.1 hypothetical protein SD71_01800 [Cohnella kolymensis]
MMKGRVWSRSLAFMLLGSLMLGLAPAAVWAEAADRVGTALVEGGKALQVKVAAAVQDLKEEPWVDDPNKTETPQYYSFSGDQVLEERPDMGADRLGYASSYFSMNETSNIFPVAQKQMTLSWTDMLATWISEQEGTPKADRRPGIP